MGVWQEGGELGWCGVRCAWIAILVVALWFFEFVRWEVVIVVGCMCSSVEGEFSVRRCCKAASGETTAVER